MFSYVAIMPIIPNKVNKNSLVSIRIQISPLSQKCHLILENVHLWTLRKIKQYFSIYCALKLKEKGITQVHFIGTLYMV